MGSAHDSSRSSAPSSPRSSSDYIWHKLELGAKPIKTDRGQWKCSKECQKGNQIILYKDSQAVQKHILRVHPDPNFNQFVCTYPYCKVKKTSPQQVLDHIGQSERYNGHEFTGVFVKYAYLGCIHGESTEKFRVKREKKDFAWFVLIPNHIKELVLNEKSEKVEDKSKSFKKKQEGSNEEEESSNGTKRLIEKEENQPQEKIRRTNLNEDTSTMSKADSVMVTFLKQGCLESSALIKKHVT